MARQKKVPISGIVLAKNAENVLDRALDSLSWMAEIVLVDNGSTDTTAKIAKAHKVKVVTSNEESFAFRRELGMKQAKHDWLFYLDADEVVTDDLRVELIELVTSNEPMVGLVRRENYFLGKKMYPDQVERLFHRSLLKGWRGELHETPEYEGEAVLSTNSLLHFTHTDIASMLEKTNHWSEIEAELRIKANHPPMSWWRLWRIALTTLWAQFVQLRLLRFGRAGLFEGYFQMVDKLIVYTKLWERQHKKN